MRLMNVALTVAFLMSGAMSTSAAEEDWRLDLEWQLDEEHACAVSYLTNIIEREVDGKMVVFVRAHCDDGRAFDGVRDDEFSLFDLQSCQLEIKEC
ncbi:MAG: hypothetical protein ACTSX7_07080 [Alphaproteobacteria bacterium]